MSIGTPDAVAALLKVTFTEADFAQVGALLDAAELLLRQRVPDLQDRAGADSLFFSLVALVEVKAVRRVMLNPTGARQRSETLDDYTQSETLDTALSSADIYITDDEWRLLGVGASSAGSFSMARGYR